MKKSDINKVDNPDELLRQLQEYLNFIRNTKISSGTITARTFEVGNSDDSSL